MKQKQQFVPEVEGFEPLATGLTDEDIAQLLALVRTVTPEKILEICSTRNDAEVRTGFRADGECGSGQWFECVRASKGWRFKKSGEWIS